MGYFDNELVSAEIKREVEGHYDDGGNWIEGGVNLVATVKADIQPKSGKQRAKEIGTDYESEYTAFVELADITFEPGYEKIKQDDKLVTEDDEYRITFEGHWSGSHYELELKEL